jgi:hypothetical protein
MAKLKGAKKEAFLKRMAAGRRKAAKANGRKPRRKRAKNAGRRSVRKTKKAIKRRTRAGIVGSKTTGGLIGRTKKKSGATKDLRRHRRRRNQEDTGAQLYEEFHQKPSTRTTEYAVAYTYPEHFAQLGSLKELRFDLDNKNKDFPLTHFKGAEVVCTPDGGNIYFIGGDQSIPLEDLDISTDKDFVELGPCTYIMYHTKKGFHDFEPIDYFHRFGEEDGIVPSLVYDRLNRALFLASGNYRVRADGIEN